MKSTTTARINQMFFLFIYVYCLKRQSGHLLVSRRGQLPPSASYRTPLAAGCWLPSANSVACRRWRKISCWGPRWGLGVKITPVIRTIDDLTIKPQRPIVILVVNQLCEVGGTTWQETCFSSLHKGRIRGPNTRKHVWAAAKQKKHDLMERWFPSW